MKGEYSFYFWFYYHYGGFPGSSVVKNPPANSNDVPVLFSSVAQSCPTLCDPKDCNTPDFPVHHQLPELAQTHVHWVSDAIQLSHPLSSPSPSAFNLFQSSGFFQMSQFLTSGGQSIEVSVSASVLPMNIHDFSFSISPSNEYSRFPSGWTG